MWIKEKIVFFIFVVHTCFSLSAVPPTSYVPPIAEHSTLKRASNSYQMTGSSLTNTQPMTTNTPNYTQYYNTQHSGIDRYSYPNYQGYNPYGSPMNLLDESYNRGAMSTSYSATTLTDTQLIGMLDEQTRRMYTTLDAEGRVLAKELASQNAYRDKNLAIYEAYRRMNERINRH